MSFIDLAGSERGADVVDQNKQTRYTDFIFLKTLDLMVQRSIALSWL